MNRTELLEVIANGENPHVEFKRDDCHPDDLAKEMSAMLNLVGGTNLLEVEDDGADSSLTRSQEDSHQWVMNVAKQNLQRSTTPVWGCMAMEGGTRIGVVKLPADWQSKLHKAKRDNAWVTYVRIGGTSREATREEEGRLYKQLGSSTTKSSRWLIRDPRASTSIERQLGQILYRGKPTPVRVKFVDTKARGNLVGWTDGQIIVRRGEETRTPAVRGLENWLRREARAAIADYIPTVTSRIGQQHGRVYVMGQRTKWGNCSSRRNLSSNRRLILAPDLVLRYLVAHEVVHLGVPDHTAKFWLTVQSVCPETERAKQWLSRHHAQLTVDLAAVLQPACSARKEKSP